MSQQEVLVIVTVDTLNVRTAPSEQAGIVPSYPRGSVLNYIEVVDEEEVAGNPRWGHSVQGHYLWSSSHISPETLKLKRSQMRCACWPLE